MVKYAYDAWGNNAIFDVNGEELTDTNNLGYINPFRYRGYYYDVETGLYYLQTRYYDPELGRFISQDSLNYANTEVVNGINLFAYCLNNPVVAIDPNGNISFDDIGNWFKKAGESIKNFFVEDVYCGVIKPATDWVTDVAAPAVENFFTNTIPDFFVNTVWNDGLVPAWDAVSNFFTTTVPDFFVNTVYYGGILPAWNWVNGDKWYQIIVKNLIISALASIVTALIGAKIGSAAGPVGAGGGAAVGFVLGFVVSFIIGTLWDFTDRGINS